MAPRGERPSTRYVRGASNEWNKKRYLVKKTMIDRQIEKISLFTNGIDFIDENDGGRSLLGLREQASNP